jgi:hypothetical protein
LHVVADPSSPKLDEGATMNDITETNGRTSRHLRSRCQQRGVRKYDLNILLEWADRVVLVGGGRVAITLTRQAATLLRAQGIAAGLIERGERSFERHAR